MPRYIRYLENNEWKYASVKTVGDLTLLKTDNKEDLVSAINSLIDGGILETVQGSLDQVQNKVDSVDSTVQSQSQVIQSQQELIDLLKKEQEELLKKADELKEKQEQVASDLDEAKTELLQKADVDYVDGQLVKKVDASVHQQKYDEIESSLLEKVSIDKYQQEYADIVEGLSQKANSIDLQSVVDSVNEDITNQTIEVNKAKTDIINLDTKVDNTKSEILTTIETVQGEADALEAKVSQQKADLESKITATQTKATNDLVTAKTELDTAIGTVQSDVDTLEETVASNKQELINKINSDVENTTELIEEVEGRVAQAETNITNANSEIVNTKESIANTQTDLNTTKQDLANVKTDLNGTKTNLSNTKADLQGKIDTANQSITNLSNSVDTKIGVVNEDIEGLKTRASGIEGDITTINREVDETKGELSTTITNLENVDGRLAEAETKVTQNAEGLTTKVSQKSYDADKLATDERLSTAETTIEQHSDAISLKAEKSDVYNKTETDDKLGNKVDSQTFNNKVSEIKLTTDGITQNVSNLQKTTSGQETRLKNAETTIDQHSDQIALKASQEEVDSISGDLKSAQAELVVQAGEIASKVEKTEYDALEGRVTNQQATVEQLSDSIAQKVSHDEYNELTQQVSTQETSILQTASQVEILSTKSEDIDGRLTEAEASITTQAGQIALKATQSEMDSVKGRVTKAEGDITAQAGQIALKASQSEMDTLTGRVSTAEGKITTQAGQINLKAEKKDVYTKAETDTKLGSKVDSSVYSDKMAEIDLTTDGITQRVSDTEGQIDTATGEITTLKSDVSTLEQTATQIQTTVSGIQDDVEGIDGRLSTTETQVTQNKNAIALKASQTDLDTVTGRVEDAEAELEVQAGQISSKVEKTTYTQDKTNMQNDINSKAKQSDLSALTTRVTNNESSITQTAEAITSKVEQDDFDTLSGTVESQGTTIAQHSSQIALKAEASNVYSKGETDNKLGSKVDNTTYNNKMAELKVTTDGISQEVTNVKGTVSTQGGQITQLNTDVSSVDQKADSIQQQVNSISTTVDEQGETISSQGTSITQLNKIIALKAEKKDVYTKTEADGKINTAVSSAKSEIQVTTDGIKQDVSKVNTTLGDHDSRLVNQQSSIEQLADSISQKVEYEEFDQATQQMAVQETEILQTKSDITLLANRTSESEDRLSVAESSIQVNADAIESKVEKTDFDKLQGTVNSQGTTIAQHSDAIKLKAEASSVYTKGETDTKLNSKVNSSTYNSKVAEIDLDIDGITQNVSNISSDLNSTKQNVSTVTQKANSIEQSVSSLSDTVDEQGRTISSQGTSISQLNSSIALKAEKSNVYTKSEADNKVSTAVNNVKSEIKVTTDGISQSVSNVDSKVDNLQIGAENILRNTAIKKDSSYIGLSTGVARDTSFLNRGLNTFKYDVSGLTSDSWRSANPTSFEAKEGEVFSSSAEVYIPTGHGIDVGSPTLEMQFFRADGSRITARATSTSKVDLSKLDQWQKVTTENIVAPAGTVKANTRLWLQRNGKLWVSHYMMNRGTKVADWSPSYLDTDVQFDDVNKSISSVDQKADSISQSVSSLSTKVDGQGTRISNAETTIGQHTTSINLKANATDVYKKTEVDSKLGKKVDTTTYSDKMSSIDVDINGIKQTASNQQTTISGIDGTVKSHTSQISTLDQRADGFDLTVKEVKDDIGGLEGRVSTAETNITANKDAIALKASAKSVSDLGTRVGTAEGKIEVNANQIAQRVTKTEMDNAVGVNKWIASRYDMNLGSSSAIPAFAHIKGKTPSSVIDYADSSKLQPFSGDYYVGHYFTNIYMETAKTVNLSVTNDDGASIFLNGASIYGKGSSTSTLTVAVAFRAGWNTIEILHYEHSGAESVNLGLKLSDNVDKMTSVIGVGDKNETRLTQAETSIVQNANDIALRATKTDVSALGNRVTENESAIKIANDKISTKVEQSDFNNYSKKLTTAESNITQLKDSITTKVEKTDFNLLNDTVKSQGTSITQLNESIALKVNSDVVDGLKNRVSSAETQITANKNAIALKASQSDLDKATGRLSSAESAINVHSDEISQRVKKTEFDALSIGGRQILRNSGQFKDLTYWLLSKGSGVTGSYALVDDATYGKVLKATYDGGTSWWVLQNSLYTYYKQKFVVDKEYTTTLMVKSTANFTVTYMDGNGTNIVFDYSLIPSTNGEWKQVSFTQKAKLEGNQPVFYLSKKDNAGEIQIAWVKLEEGSKSTGWGLSPDEVKGDLTELGDRMHEAETSITQTSEAITLKADKSTTYTKTDVDNKIGEVNLKISNQATELQQTNEAITLKANKTDVYTKTESSNLLANKTDKSDFNAVVTRVSNAEASLKVANDNIATKVAQSTFDVLNDKVSLNTDSTNYNPNPSFEGKKSTGYTHAQAFASTDSGVPSGAPKKYVGRQNGRDNYINDFFSVKAGDKFIVEGWIASTDSSQSFGLGLNTQDDAGNNQWLVSGQKSKGSGVWQYFKQTYTIPSGKNKARFFSQINASSSFGNWYFTDVRITKVIDQSQVDGLETKLSTMQTSIDQTSSAITLKANASDVYTKSQTDNNVSKAITDAKSEIKVTTDGIKQSVSNLSSTVSGQASTISSHSTSISQLNSSITSKAEKSSVYTKAEADGKISTAISSAKSEIKQTTDGITSTVSALDTKVGNISIGGRNLLLGTGNAKTATGKGGSNETTNFYDLITRDYSLVAGKQITISFDIVFSVNSGTAVLQWNSTPWGSLADRVNASTTKKHYSFTKTSPTDGIAKGVQLRLDGVTGTATISNVKLELGNKESDWSPAFEDIQVGGRNKILNSSFKNGTTNWSSFSSTVSVVDDSTSPTGKAVRIIGSGTNGGMWYASSKLAPNGMEVGKEYTTSIIAKGSGKLEIGIERLGSTSTIDLTSDYRKYTVTQFVDSVQNIVFYLKDGANVYIHSIKLEEGNRASEWTPAPEDVDGSIDSINSTLSTQSSSISQLQNSITSKVEKSAVYTKSETDGKISTSISSAKSEIKQTTDEIKSSVSSVSQEVADSSQNMVRNTSFVKNLDYWQVSVGTIDSSKAVDGNNAVKIEVSGLTSDAWRGIISNGINVGAGQYYNASVYAYTDNLSLDTSGSSYYLEVEWFNTAGTRLGTNRTTCKPTTVNVWQRFNLSAKAPANAVKATIRFYVQRNGRMWISRPMMVLGNKVPSAYSPMPSDSSLSDMSTQIVQTANEVSTNVVKKGNVVSSINASGEGVKIKGDKIDISGAVTFSSLNSDMQSKINAGTSAKTAIDNLDVGGSNLLTGTNFDSTSGFYGWGSGSFTSITTDSYVGFNYLRMETKDSSGNCLTVSKGTAIGIQTSGHTFRVIKGRQYTVSMIIATSELDGVLDYCYLMHGNGASNLTLPNVNTYGFPYVTDVSSGSPTTRGYYKVSYTFTADVTDDKAYILIGGRTTRDLGGSSYAWIRLSQLQVEEGNKATSWGLSPVEIHQGIGSAQSTANTANSKAGTAQSTADSATTKANNAQNTANTANSTANYAKTTVDNGKSKWEGAYNLTQTWRRGNTTEIDGGNISTQSIQAKSMVMADFTNLCENPDFELDSPNTNPLGFTGGSNYRVVDISSYSYGNGTNRALQVDASATASSSAYMSNLIPVSKGQQFYVGAEARYYNTNGSGYGRIGFKTYDGKKTSDNHWYTAVAWTGTKNQTFDYKSGTFTVPDGVSYIQVWISFSANDTTNNSFIIDNIRIHRMANAELIVDGVIEGRHIKADSISFDKAKGGTLKLGGVGNENGVLEVYNSSGELIANLDGDKGGFTSLYVADFESPTVVSNGSDNLTFYVSDRWLDYSGAVDPSDENSGNGWAQPLATVAEALRRIPKYYSGQAVINLPYNGVFYEDILISGFLGSGRITISGGNGVKVNGTVQVDSCTVSVYVKNFTINSPANTYACASAVKSDYAVFENVSVYGNNSQRGFDIRDGSNGQVNNSEVYACDVGITSRYGATCYQYNNKGLATYGIQGYAGFMLGGGTCPNGTKSYQATAYGGTVSGSFTADSGSATPPPAPEAKKTFSFNSGNSWRDNFSGQWYNQGVVAQGYWSGYGVYRGLWFFGSSLSDTVKGKTIKSMRVYIKRTSSGGNSGAVTCYFRSHNYTSQPSGKPTLGDKYTTATFKWGEGKWINIPSTMWADFTSGTAKGIGIYVNSTSNNYYARFETSVQIEVTYK